MQDYYDERCNELTSALGEVGRVKSWNISLIDEKDFLESRIKNYVHLSTTGCRNLKVKDYINPDIPDIPKYTIAVVGQDTINPDLCFVIKSFSADNEEDREFAIREAEELIETINKF